MAEFKFDITEEHIEAALKDQLEERVDKVWADYQKDAIAMLLAKANALSKAE